MTTHVVEMFENYTSYGFGEEGKLWKSSEVLKATGVEFVVPGQTYQTRGTRFVLEFWDANCVGRTEFRGPVAQRAHASFSAQATVIAANPVANPVARARVLTVEFGDLIVCPALDLVVEVCDGGRHADPVAKILHCQPATVDYSELVAAKNAEPLPPYRESDLY